MGLSTDDLISLVLNTDLDISTRRNALHQLANQTTPKQLKELLDKDEVKGFMAFNVWSSKMDSDQFQALRTLLNL